MAHRASVSRFPRTGAPRRKTAWIFGPEGIVTNITATANTLLPTGLALTTSASTIVRMRGELALQLTAADALGSGFHWGFGMCVVTAAAFAIGASAVPNALTDIGWDGWFFHQQGHLISVDATPDEQTYLSPRWLIDSKAMRKVKDTDVVTGVISTVEVGTSVMQAQVATRLLLKLH